MVQAPILLHRLFKETARHRKVSLSILHKEEREDILQSVGLKVEHGDEIDYGQSRGAYRTVGDQEHLDIIESYLTEKLSMGKIAKKLDRRTATVYAQVHAHN
jgi:hypothetical protein